MQFHSIDQEVDRQRTLVTAEVFVKQLSDLSPTRHLTTSCDQVGLYYSNEVSSNDFCNLLAAHIAIDLKFVF